MGCVLLLILAEVVFQKDTPATCVEDEADDRIPEASETVCVVELVTVGGEARPSNRIFQIYLGVSNSFVPPWLAVYGSSHSLCR